MHQIYHVEDEQWLGGLLHANDELIMALMTFEQLDRSIDADSDSEDELAEQAHLYRSKSSLNCIVLRMLTITVATEKGKAGMFPDDGANTGGPVPEMDDLSIAPPMPPRPTAPPRPSAMSKSSLAPKPPVPPVHTDDGDDDISEDENDPFADSNAVATPAVERSEPRW